LLLIQWHFRFCDPFSFTHDFRESSFSLILKSINSTLLLHEYDSLINFIKQFLSFQTTLKTIFLLFLQNSLYILISQQTNTTILFSLLSFDSYSHHHHSIIAFKVLNTFTLLYKTTWHASACCYLLISLSLSLSLLHITQQTNTVSQHSCSALLLCSVFVHFISFYIMFP
jgi:hypothetical protein